MQKKTFNVRTIASPDIYDGYYFSLRKRFAALSDCLLNNSETLLPLLPLPASHIIGALFLRYVYLEAVWGENAEIQSRQGAANTDD